MKINSIIMIMIVLFCSKQAFSQAYTSAYRADMCDCLEEESLKRKLTENSFKMCFKEVLPTYAAQIDAAIIEEDLNKKYLLGQIARKNLILGLQYELVYTCDVYYEHIDSNRISKKLIAREQAKESDLENRNQLVALSPNALAYFMRAQLQFNLGNIKEAEADIQKSLELNPNKENTLATRHELLLLAWVYEEYERYSDAVTIYDKVTFGELDTSTGVLRALADKKAGGTLSNIPKPNEGKVPKVNLNSRNRRQPATIRSSTKKSQRQAKMKTEKKKTKKESDTSSLKKLFKIDN